MKHKGVEARYRDGVSLPLMSKAPCFAIALIIFYDAVNPDDFVKIFCLRFSVIPVKTGVHFFNGFHTSWIPACTGKLPTIRAERVLE